MKKAIMSILTVWIMVSSVFTGLISFGDIENVEAPYTTHDPFRINSDAEFASMAGLEGWDGDGSPGNPYIIEGYDINGSGYGYCIYIGNTTVHFEINDSYLYEASGVYSMPYYPRSGITLYNVQNGTIANITADSNKRYGIYLESSSNNTIANNNASSNDIYGIHLQFCDGNTIINNTASSNNWAGIVINDCIEHSFKNNKMEECGIIIKEGNLETWNSHKLDTSNTVNSKPVYYWKNQTSGEIPLGAGEVILANCTNVIVRNQNVSNGSVGILLGFSDNNTINNNNASNNYDGIYLLYSNRNIIVNNNASLNRWNGIRLYSSNNNTIINNTIYLNKESGISLYYSINNTITDNTVLFNDDGIYLRMSNNNTIDNNNASSSNSMGICLWSSNNNTIANNTASSNNTWGIFFDDSNNNTIANNTASNNTYGINLQLSSDNNKIVNNTASSDNLAGIVMSGCIENYFINNKMEECGIIIKGENLKTWNSHKLDTSNTVNNKPVYYWKNQTIGEIPPGAGEVILANCTKVIVKNQNVSNASVGILLGFSNNNTIDNNTALNNYDSIYLFHSNRNIIINNNASLNDWNGIHLYYSSSNTIANNTASNNYFSICLSHSYDNTITNNTASNSDYGIFLSSSNTNKIFHNNIINNTNQASDSTNNGNLWDNGYPSGGNYWSDYSGVDNFKGPNQDQPGSDGIGDSEYSIDSNSKDHYPLMEPYIYKPLENYTILKKGWNLISIALVQEETDLIKVLEMIDGYYDCVEYYNITDKGDHWKINNTAKPFGNDLTEITEKMGFWIHITNPGETIFLYNGTQPTKNQTINLFPGWNLVGYPSQTNYNRTDGLNNITFDTNVDSIWTYNATNQRWDEIGPLDYFEVGKGYWIHVKTKCFWEVPL